MGAKMIMNRAVANFALPLRPLRHRLGAQPYFFNLCGRKRDLSVGLDAGRLDHRRPPIHFIGHELCRLRGRVPYRIEAEIGETLLRLRRNERGRDPLVQALTIAGGVPAGTA